MVRIPIVVNTHSGDVDTYSGIRRRRIRSCSKNSSAMKLQFTVQKNARISAVDPFETVIDGLSTVRSAAKSGRSSV